MRHASDVCALPATVAGRNKEATCIVATIPKQARRQRKTSRPAFTPALRATQGEDAVALVRQLDLSPPASRISVSPDGRWVAVAAASRRTGNLALYNMRHASVVWRGTLDAPSAHVFALDEGGCIAITESGRIGAGTTDLHFFDPRGQLRAAARLDDKLTEAQVVDGAVIVGCRDGYLYKYDLRGALSWAYQVSSHAGIDLDPDDLYQRPCPYFVRASFIGDHILFSSWDRLVMLDRSGALRWTWRTKLEPEEVRVAVPAQPRVASGVHYRLLGVARTASADDVRRAFRRKAFETHPDRNADDPRAADRFKEAMGAYEAIRTAQRTGLDRPSLSIEIRLATARISISGLAVGDDGRAIASSLAGLTFIDVAGRAMQHVIAADGGGAVHASGDLRRMVYAQWQGLSFYTSDALVKLLPTDRLYHVTIRRDGRHVIAWYGRQLLGFDERSPENERGERLATITIVFRQDFHFAGPVPLFSDPCSGVGDEGSVPEEHLCRREPRTYRTEAVNWTGGSRLLHATIDLDRRAVVDLFNPAVSASVDFMVEYYREHYDGSY